MKNRNLSFVVKCILAALPALLMIGFIALCPHCYMDEEYPAWEYTIKQVRGHGNVTGGRIASGSEHAESDSDIVILGDSRAMADLLPEVLTDGILDQNGQQKSCINLAVGGATPLEMYYFYISYLENHKAPETVIVMFAPFHYTYMDNYQTRTLYFNALRNRDYRELMRVAMRYGSESVLFENHAAYHLSCVMRFPDVYLPALYNSHFVGRRLDNNLRYMDLVKSHGQGYFGTDDSNSDKAYEATYTEMAKSGDADLLEFYAGTLYTLLSKSCKNVILVQPPMNETTYDNLDADYVMEYQAYIDNLCEGLDNFTYSTEFLRYDNDCFGDASHLNERGAKRYTKEFRDRYRTILTTTVNN